MQRVQKKTFVSLFLTIYPFLRKLPKHARCPFFYQGFHLLIYSLKVKYASFPHVRSNIFIFVSCALCFGTVSRFSQQELTQRMNQGYQRMYQTPTLWKEKKKKGKQNCPSLRLLAAEDVAFQFAQFYLFVSWYSSVCHCVCRSSLVYYHLALAWEDPQAGSFSVPCGEPEQRTRAPGQGCCSFSDTYNRQQQCWKIPLSFDVTSDYQSPVFIFVFYPQAKPCPNPTVLLVRVQLRGAGREKVPMKNLRGCVTSCLFPSNVLGNPFVFCWGPDRKNLTPIVVLNDLAC